MKEYEYDVRISTEQNKAKALYAIATELSRIADASVKFRYYIGSIGSEDFRIIEPRTIPEKK